MTIRLRETSIETTIHDLPQDMIPLFFRHLNLADLLIVERVCKLWHKLSVSDSANWDRASYQKAIFVDRSLPIRPQVLASFVPYCEGARLIFPERLGAIPTGLSPIVQKELIDMVIAEMDKTKLDPLQALSEYWMLVDQSDCIPDCIKMIPVWVEMDLLTVNEDLFFNLFKKEGHNHLKHVVTSSRTLSQIANTSQILLMTENQDLNPIEIQKTIKDLQLLQNDIFSLIEYSLHFVEKPSQDITVLLCIQFAIVQVIRPTWHEIGLIRYEKRAILTPLLQDLRGEAWEEAFKQFMLDNGVNVDIEIHYPLYIQKIVKKMNDEEFQCLIDKIPNFTPSNNIYLDYMKAQIMNDIRRSLTLLRIS